MVYQSVLYVDKVQSLVNSQGMEDDSVAYVVVETAVLGKDTADSLELYLIQEVGKHQLHQQLGNLASA